jgi:hypothetical protein
MGKKQEACGRDERIKCNSIKKEGRFRFDSTTTQWAQMANEKKRQKVVKKGGYSFTTRNILGCSISSKEIRQGKLWHHVCNPSFSLYPDFNPTSLPLLAAAAAVPCSVVVAFLLARASVWIKP